MPIKLTNYELPEFAFLEATSHLGTPLEGRDVLHHIRSYTLLEVIALNDVLAMDFGDNKTHDFVYKNSLGIEEKFMFVVHFSLAEEFQLPEIFERCEEFYKAYLAWEDNNIIIDEQSTSN